MTSESAIKVMYVVMAKKNGIVKKCARSTVLEKLQLPEIIFLSRNSMLKWYGLNFLIFEDVRGFETFGAGGVPRLEAGRLSESAARPGLFTVQTTRMTASFAPGAKVQSRRRAF